MSRVGSTKVKGGDVRGWDEQYVKVREQIVIMFLLYLWCKKNNSKSIYSFILLSLLFLVIITVIIFATLRWFSHFWGELKMPLQ